MKIENLAQNIVRLLKNAQHSVLQTVNQTMVMTYFEIGRMVVEEEQAGKQRAMYGTKLLKALSEKLTQELKIQDFTYRFKNKNLSVYFIKNKDLQKMKVFNYNSQGTDQFYLYFEEKYYLISESASKLVALQDEDSISELDEIQ